MGAQSKASTGRGTGTGTGAKFAASAVDRLRSQLEVDLRMQTAALAARRVAFASDACRTMSLECARAALEMYRTRRTIEDIEDALSRIECGRYDICQTCERPV